MADRNTRYLVGFPEPDSGGRRIWTWLTTDYVPPAGSSRPDWAWTGDRKRATRFAGRAEARAIADRCTAWMAANGHPGVTLHLVPATGGVPVGAPMLD